MRIFNPNVGKEIVPIVKNHAYMYITDYGIKALLKEIKIGPGQHTWYWIKMDPNRFIDISEINGYYCSFDNAINRAVNDPYCTVYGFDNYDEMIKCWEKIVYIDKITTVYKGDKKEG